jgi:hypothetical protein
MDVTVQVALIGALFTFFAGLLATIVNFFHERSEKEKWKRTLELEERRLRYEENKWALELNSQREQELHKLRLKTYPEIFAALEIISHHHQDKLTDDVVRELADKLNGWGYAEAGLCMLSDTRKSLFDVVDKLRAFLRKEITSEDLRHGARQDLIERMRRDLSHNWSLYRNLQTLTDKNIESIQKVIGEQPKTG